MVTGDKIEILKAFSKLNYNKLEVVKMEYLNAIKYVFDVKNNSFRHEEYNNIKKTECGWVIGDEIISSNNIGCIRALNENTLYCILFEDDYKTYENWVRKSFLNYKRM